MTKTQNVLLAIAILVVGFVAGASVGSRASSNVGLTGFHGGPQFAGDVAITGDLYAGTNGTQITNNGTVVGSVAGAINTAVNATLSGYTYVKSLIGSTGQTVLTASATTTTLTAAQICAGGGVIAWTPTTNNATATLPTTALLQAACLPTVGDSIFVQFINGAATNTYNLVSGTGQTKFHIMESATTTSQGTTITSSTPINVRIQLTLASGTDSTANEYFTKFLTP